MKQAAYIPEIDKLSPLVEAGTELPKGEFIKRYKGSRNYSEAFARFLQALQFILVSKDSRGKISLL